MPSVSFEYFPQRSSANSDVLDQTVQILAEFQPDFQSVTYGAGGTSQAGTLETLSELHKTTLLPVASHLTYSGSDLETISEFVEEIWESGVRRIVALRGDARENSEETQAFDDTAEFVAFLKSRHPFEIAVSCYPEVHPKAESLEEDLRILKAKQDAGASVAISQFFFDNSVFYQFVQKARDAGITIPIVPGILPIYNFDRVKDMAGKCGTAIPDYVCEAFENSNKSGASQLEVASELLKAQVHDLACAGYETIHIYTLNRAPLAKIAASTFMNAHASIDQKSNRQVA
ncbi:MAG: methylenetetrahydrofolate reductase [Pseudomonadota bacterium]